MNKMNVLSNFVEIIFDYASLIFGQLSDIFNKYDYDLIIPFVEKEE